jgi:hypothetical protein
MNHPRTFLIVAAAALAFAASGCSEVSNREDFTSQVKNKTEAEVVKFVGKPASVDNTDPARVMWVYKSRTFDVATRQTDPETDVIFAKAPDGKLHVADVVFK